MRQPADSLAFFEQLAQKPWEYDFFHVMRMIECLHPQFPRIGQAVRPAQEAIRLGQEPSLDFASTVISGVHAPTDGGAAMKIEVRFLGMLGPNGPLPLHLTDYARERILHGGDATLARFLDVFNHRFLSLFYRAWAQAQPAVTHDRPAEDRFPVYIGSLFGLGSARMRNRDTVPDAAKLFHAGLLSRQVRNRDGLEALLENYFKVPVCVQEFAGHWMDVAAPDQSRLGMQNASVMLARGAVLGSRIWDRQHSIRLRIGPLDLDRYEALLPGGADIEVLVAWLRTYLCLELAWDLCLVLREEQVASVRLGQYGRLGWTSWLGNYRRGVPADDLRLDAEKAVAQHRAAQSTARSGATMAAAGVGS